VTTVLTRVQAIEVAGVEAVEAVEAINCEPTNRVGVQVGDTAMEWAASVDIEHEDYDTLTAIYMIDEEQQRALADADGDGSAITWEIDHYVVD